MCGIVGYIGKDNNIRTGLDALKRLEYRGYDSSGLAVYDNEKKEIVSVKAVGKIEKLEEKLKGMNIEGVPSIFHTRWATHGEVTEENAHPHFDCNKNIYVVHNGIIENYKELKEELIKDGHDFTSETDTEVIAHLIEYFFKEKNDLYYAVNRAVERIKGTYGLLAIARDDPCKIVAARLSSPLLIGPTEDGYMIASDPAAICSFSKKVIFLEDKEVALITPDNCSVARAPQELDFDGIEVEKNGYSHFMIKEIFEQPEAIRNSIKGRLIPQEGNVKFGGLTSTDDRLRDITRIIIIACGTARHAALVGEYMIEEYARIPVEVDNSSEFRYRKPIINKNTAVLAISQSGETADTLAAIKEAKNKGALVLGITNAVGSTQTRETDAGIYNHIGPEIGVASTKAFVSQVAILAALAVYLGRQREMSLVTGKRITEELEKLPDLIEKVLKNDKQIKELAKKYSKFKDFFFLGRKYNYPIAVEGALKLKEIVHSIHAEGYAAGELKHGPIALVDEEFPSICIAPSDSVYEKMMSNMEEIKARKGKIIAIATEGDEEVKKVADEVICIPKTLEMLSPILTVIPLQLFAAYIGIELGFDIDKPRNLAKSVTVE